MTNIIDDHLYAEIATTSGATKHCTACDEPHPVEAFAFKSKANLKLHSQCRATRRNKAKAAYAADGHAQRSANAARRAAAKVTIDSAVDAWLDGRRCDCCGSTNSLCAVGSVGTSLKRLPKLGWSAAAIEAELTTATVRCRRCGQAGVGR